MHAKTPTSYLFSTLLLVVQDVLVIVVNLTVSMQTHREPLLEGVVALCRAAHKADDAPPAVILDNIECPKVTPLAPLQLHSGTLSRATGVRPP